MKPILTVSQKFTQRELSFNLRKLLIALEKKFGFGMFQNLLMIVF